MRQAKKAYVVYCYGELNGRLHHVTCETDDRLKALEAMAKMARLYPEHAVCIVDRLNARDIELKSTVDQYPDDGERYDANEVQTMAAIANQGRKS